MKNILIALFLIAMLSCTSKQDNAIIYRDFINEEWSRFDFLEGDITIKKAPIKYDVIMEVAVSEIFPNVYENHRSDNSLLFNECFQFDILHNEYIKKSSIKIIEGFFGVII